MADRLTGIGTTAATHGIAEHTKPLYSEKRRMAVAGAFAEAALVLAHVGGDFQSSNIGASPMGLSVEW